MRWILGVALCAFLVCGCGGGDNMRTDPSKPRGEGLTPTSGARQQGKAKIDPITPD